jgi:hypothetical protein
VSDETDNDETESQEPQAVGVFIERILDDDGKVAVDPRPIGMPATEMPTVIELGEQVARQKLGLRVR